MRETTLWERFKRAFTWGRWSWRTVGFYHGHILVIGKIKVTFPDRTRA